MRSLTLAGALGVLGMLAACEQGAISFAGEDADDAQALDYDPGDADAKLPDAVPHDAFAAEPGPDGADPAEPPPDSVEPATEVADEASAAEPSTDVEGPDTGLETGGDLLDPDDDGGPDTPEPVSVTSTDDWSRVEHYSLDNPGLVPEPFLDRTRHTDADVVAAFGTDAPPVTDFLLHAAPGWDDGTGPVVLLLHGAGTNATQSFAQPALLNDAALAVALPTAGYRVFALTFAAPFGSNRNQAVTVAQALQLLRARTGVARVSVVAHSKAGLAALAYVRGLVATWDLPYADDVDRLVLLGVPLDGMDWSFRHPNPTYAVDVMSLSMPTAWDRILEWGSWKDITEISIYGGAYNGLLEALTPWIDTYLLSGLEQDWYTTWYGGQGFVSHSLGIDAAIEMGGNFMEQLHAAPMPSQVAVAALAGGNGLVGGVAWETTGPSDGMVFVQSATAMTDFKEAGCPILGVDELILENHWSLLSSPDALAFVQDALAATF
jgi:hypothetical protein